MLLDGFTVAVIKLVAGRLLPVVVATKKKQFNYRRFDLRKKNLLPLYHSLVVLNITRLSRVVVDSPPP